MVRRAHSSCAPNNIHSYIHLGGGGVGGSDIRSMSSIRPICKCRCPPLPEKRGAYIGMNQAVSDPIADVSLEDSGSLNRKKLVLVFRFQKGGVCLKGRTLDSTPSTNRSKLASVEPKSYWSILQFCKVTKGLTDILEDPANGPWKVWLRSIGRGIIQRIKRLAIFPSPAGMSLTKFSLTGNNLIPAGDGNIANLFYSVAN